jgi:hypothetical protein
MIYFTGDLYDSVTVGGTFLSGPDWVFDYLTVKFDSSGTILWANDVPNGPSITGDLRLAAGNTIAADDSGYFQVVNFRGSVDIGNNQQIGFSTPMVSYGFSVIRFDHQGMPLWHIDVPTVYGIYPFTICQLPDGGYLTGTAVGSQQFGSVNITVPSASTYFSWAARFSSAVTTGLGEVSAPQAPLLFPNPSGDGRLAVTFPKEGGSLSIVDVRGCTVRCYPSVASEQSIDTGLPSGTYFIIQSSGPPARWIVSR